MQAIVAYSRRAAPRVALPAAVVAAFLCLALPAQAQFTADLQRSNPKVVKLFRSVVADASESTVRVRCDGKDVALGTIVGADGWIITKASELNGKAVCRLKDGEEYPATIVGEDNEFDLAMLKIDASELKPIEWDDTRAARVGRWVASVAPAADPVAIGIISVAARKFKAGDQPPKTSVAAAGWLGVGLAEDARGVRITLVEPKGPADRAGLQPDDIVTHINGKKMSTVETMIATVQKYKPGDEITVNYLREDEENDVRAKLEKRPAKLLGGNPQERMGSALSSRQGGFPIILQHDTVLKPADCGGPLVDLDGKAVGINISRAGRTETYAIPAEAVRDLLSRLKSGELAPKREK